MPTESGAVQQQQQFVCTGDCLACSKGQRQYCTCQMTYNMARTVQAMQGTITAMAAAIDELKAKVAAIQEDGDSVFELTEAPTEIAQNGQRRRK